jgi:hypothetical protein
MVPKVSECSKSSNEDLIILTLMLSYTYWENYSLVLFIGKWKSKLQSYFLSAKNDDLLGKSKLILLKVTFKIHSEKI